MRTQNAYMPKKNGIYYNATGTDGYGDILAIIFLQTSQNYMEH